MQNEDCGFPFFILHLTFCIFHFLLCPLWWINPRMPDASSPPPIITLLTDFGEASGYVSAMKGVILSINPALRLVDLSHAVPPQNIRAGAFALAEAAPF